MFFVLIDRGKPKVCSLCLYACHRYFFVLIHLPPLLLCAYMLATVTSLCYTLATVTSLCYTLATATSLCLYACHRYL